MSPTRSRGDGASESTFELRFGHDELVVRQRYEVVSILNDILVGLWFLVGSILFFSDTLSYAGTWLFVLGSVELLIRPSIRLVRRVHLRRFHSDAPGSADAGHDF